MAPMMKKPASQGLAQVIKKKPSDNIARMIKKKPSGNMKTMDDIDMVKKKPAGQSADDHQVVTEAALLQLDGTSTEKVGEWLDTLKDTEQQKLWKRYENDRLKNGEHEMYKNVTTGTGGKKIARDLLKIWVKSGCNSKAATYQKNITSIASSTKRGTSDMWQPLHYMLNHRYGPKQLKAMVASHAILVRRNPRDPRFPEFLDTTDYMNSSTEQSKVRAATIKDKALWEDFEMLTKMENTGQQIQFLKGEPEEAALGASEVVDVALGKKWKNTDLTGLELRQNSQEFGAGSVASESSNLIKVIEDAESVITSAKAGETNKMKVSLAKAKMVISSAKNQLQVACASNKKLASKVVDRMKELNQVETALEKASSGVVTKPSTSKAIIVKAASVAKSCFKLMYHE